jgi:hypothetical protein
MTAAHRFAKGLQYLPLTLFLVSARSTGDYRLAFMLGGAAAVVETAAVARWAESMDRFLLAVNLFLAVGGLGFAAGIEPLQQLLGDLRQTAVFVSLVAVGAVTTVASPRGFVNVSPADAPARRILRASLTMLGLSVGALLWSRANRASFLLSAPVPFLALAVARQLLLRKITRRELD